MAGFCVVVGVAARDDLHITYSGSRREQNGVAGRNGCEIVLLLTMIVHVAPMILTIGLGSTWCQVLW